jgi:hypothetical protein
MSWARFCGRGRILLTARPFPFLAWGIQSDAMIHDNLPAAIEDLSARMIAIRDSL